VLTASCCAQADRNTLHLSSDGVEEFIRTNHIASVEQFLERLPDSYLSHYVLVFNSRSLQSSTFANPRVLMYGTTARLVMSFNGSPDETGYDALELFEFIDQTKSFQLEEIQFPAPGDQNAQVIFSEKNPQRCLRCHSANPHPLWDAPPLWPGSYGEVYHEKLSDSETGGLYAWLRAQPTHARYRHLKNTALYQDDATFYPSRHNVYVGAEIEAPNAQLSRLLTTLNNEKIMQQVMSSPGFSQFRYALLASLSSNCTALPTYFPQPWQRQLEIDHAGFAALDEIYLQRALNRKLQRKVADKSPPGVVSNDNSLRDFRYIAERALGIDTSEWSMALEKNAPDFTALDPIKLLLEKKLISRISAEDKNIMQEYYFRSYPENNRYCAYLEKQSRRALEGLELTQAMALPHGAAAPLTQNLGAAQIVQVCASCHTTGVAPRIEFNDPAALAARLNLPYSARGTLLNEILYRISSKAGARRMPPTINFSEPDLEELGSYFRDLSQPANPSKPDQ
jgi:mono/diheme cytochrome c family protein